MFRVPSLRSARPAGRLAALALGLLLTAGCASAGTADGPFDDRSQADQIRIEVENHNFSDVTVWAVVQGARRSRLGTVRGKSDSVFTLPWDFSLPLALELDLVAGPRCTTEELTVDPGDSVQLQIQAAFLDTRGCR